MKALAYIFGHNRIERTSEPFHGAWRPAIFLTPLATHPIHSPFNIKHHVVVGQFECFLLSSHRRSATSDQIASTTPKGHAPCRKP